MANKQPRLTAAFGGGGPFGIAYAFGVVDALTEAGMRLKCARLLGTSAGSWVAACLATGIPYEALKTLPPVPVPQLHPGLLQAVATELLGDAHSPLVRASTVRLSNGRKVILAGDEHRLADMVAASSSVPWLFPPTRIGGHRYVDGGVRSMVSADQATPGDHLLVIAPLAGPMFGQAGRAMEVLLRREIRRWITATQGTVHMVRPNREIATMARHPLDLFDLKLAASVYPMARQQTVQLLKDRPSMMALCSKNISTAA